MALKKVIFIKKIIRIFIFLFLSLFLFSCNQFATEEDKNRVMYAFDSSFEDEYLLNGTTKYGYLDNENEIKNKRAIPINKGENFYKWQDCSASKLLEEIKKKATEDKIIIPSDDYWFYLDNYLLEEVLKKGNYSEENIKKGNYSKEDIKKCLQKFGYVKFEKKFEKIHRWSDEIFKEHKIEMGDDFRKLYEEMVQKKIEGISSYISLKKDFLYGNFGFSNRNGVYLEPKNWHSLKFSSFDFVFIYPITYLIEKMTFKFGNNSFAKILSIFIIIFFIRLVAMLLFSIKAGVDQQKIKDLQGDLEKVKEKFSNYDPKMQRILFSQEQRKIFKKNNINMFFIFIDLVFKLFSFVFISNAIKASAILTTGSFFNLFFNKSIKNAIFQKPGVSNGWLTGFIIFIIIILVQVSSIKISNFYQKRVCNKKSVIAIQKQKNKNFVPFIFFSIITIVGFFLSINISVYIVCTSLLDIVQTLIIHLIVLKKYREKELQISKE